MAKKLIAGNWKMNGTESGAAALIREIGERVRAKPALTQSCDFLVCPPFLHLSVVKGRIDHGHFPVRLGGQDCSANPDGAYTGDVSAAMLRDCGCDYVILGHSERRQHHAESSAQVMKKAAAAHSSGLVAIICVGETDQERAQGRAYDVVAAHLDGSLPATAGAVNTVIAYEPVWAIGTGRNATPDDVAAMHAFIRGKLQEKLADGKAMRILYGGSVKPENARALFVVPDVDGALIGGASLKADQFVGIAEAV